jgi:hypothetical protein
MPLKCVTAEQFNTGTWYTIDPGIHTAIQEWDDGEMRISKVVDISKQVGMKAKIDKLSEVIDTAFPQYLHSHGVIIEGVSLRTGSVVSMASGARGNLFLLAYIVGAIMAIFVEKGFIVHDPILYQEWAGQLSYKQLRNILLLKFGCDCSNEHIAAARGIGYAAKGLL